MNPVPAILRGTLRLSRTCDDWMRGVTQPESPFTVENTAFLATEMWCSNYWQTTLEVGVKLYDLVHDQWQDAPSSCVDFPASFCSVWCEWLGFRSLESVSPGQQCLPPVLAYMPPPPRAGRRLQAVCSRSVGPSVCQSDTLWVRYRVQFSKHEVFYHSTRYYVVYYIALRTEN